MLGPAHLDDVAVGVFGVGADKDAEKGRGAIVGRHHTQHFLEVVLVPAFGQSPSPNLERRLCRQ